MLNRGNKVMIFLWSIFMSYKFETYYRWREAGMSLKSAFLEAQKQSIKGNKKDKKEFEKELTRQKYVRVKIDAIKKGEIVTPVSSFIGIRLTISEYLEARDRVLSQRDYESQVLQKVRENNLKQLHMRITKEEHKLIEERGW